MRIYAAEKLVMDPRVVALFQKKAWADTSTYGNI